MGLRDLGLEGQQGFIPEVFGWVADFFKVVFGN